MAKHDEIPARPAAADKRWTRAQDYVALLRLQRRTADKLRQAGRSRPQRGEPFAALGLLPFIALMAALAVVAIAIFTVAAPGLLRSKAPPPVKQEEKLGTAPPGWIDEPSRR